MLKYIIKRLLIGALTLFILATITFFGVHAMPGDPFSQEGRGLSPETYAALEEKYGLDKPVSEQYVIYMSNALHGDFGESISKKGQQVSDIIAQRAPVTARIGLIAFAFSMTVGLLLGCTAALTKKRGVNGAITVFATLGVSIPSFLFALLMMILFGVWLGWLPVVGLKSWKHYIMPCLALSLSPISNVTRLQRSSMRDVLNEDYITLARSTGDKESKVILRHALKNSILPVVTYAGPMFSGLVTGSLVIETLFSIPGIGREFTNSITNRDYTLVMGLTMFLGAIVIVMNLVSDIAAALIDPRIKYEK
jgi:oligopeptide transport system permease protein